MRYLALLALAAVAPVAPPAAEEPLLFFWGVGCPHCDQAMPFVDALARERPDLSIERIEVRRDPAGRERFLRTVETLAIQAPGIPLFVRGDRYVIGFRAGVSEREVKELLGDGARSPTAVTLPLVGRVDPARMPLWCFTLLVGLLDGVNPCAMWVLLVLLGILLHVRSRPRLFLFGGVFVVMSGVVYFLFMSAWHGLFRLVGLSRTFTVGLGVVVLLMGLINLKELFWLKKGVSLTIPDRAKPGLYRRMRAIANAASLPTALLGITLLAFVVNLIELGCTLGLPAVYTRILSLRVDLSAWTRHGYLALYNVAYVVPLAAIVLVFATTLHRFAMRERGAKGLKVVSGLLLVLFGLLLLAAPDWLG